jgi:hypothetical protein
MLRQERGRQVIQMGKGKNKEYSDRVINEVLEHWDRDVCKTTNQEGDREDEVD